MRGWVPILVALGLAVVGTVVAFAILDARDEARLEELRAQREEQRERRADERFAAHRRESASVLPAPLAGAAIGMRERELREARPNVQTDPTPRDAAEKWLKENLASGSVALYGFDDGRLSRIQVQSQIDPRGVGPHLTAMREEYGAPSGVYRCAPVGGIGTLRFVWRKSHLSVQDIFLFHTGGVAVNLYIAPTPTVVSSLQMSQCRPIRSRAELEDLPIATPDLLREHEIGRDPEGS